MNNNRLTLGFATAVLLVAGVRSIDAEATNAPRAQVAQVIEANKASLVALYKHWHAHPELSLQETQSAARLAQELEAAGFKVTRAVGTNGVVAVMRNGEGPTLLVRSDMDALPVRELTKLPYASTATMTNRQGDLVPVMHACGHDVHMACLVGTARVLSTLKQQWSGTLVLIGQPAEEIGSGAKAMLADGLFKRFPEPDYCLALHDDPELPAGTIGYTPGNAMASVDSVDIIVRGVGGHGAHPHKTKDPIVLAAQIVLALQTIVSREVQPGQPAVVTVGSIHGGTKHNIISEEVKLQLTIRSYSEEVRNQLLEAIRRIARGQALAAGVPEDRFPEVSLVEESTRATYNTPELAERVAGVIRSWLGDEKVVLKPASMGGEDFNEFGRTEKQIPICMFTLGGVDPGAYESAKREGRSLPSLHSALWAPLPEPTIVTGVTAMSAVVMDILSAKPTAAQ